MKFSRKLSGLLGIISFAIMAVVVLTILTALQMPPAVVWGGGAFLALLLLSRVISAIRGSGKRSRDYSTFESNALGEPVTETFKPPYHRDLPLGTDEKVLARAAPVMQVMTGLGDMFRGGTLSFLGKGKSTDAENALVLTHRRLFFMMIGPDEVLRYSSNPRIARLLETLPGKAGDKRRMLWHRGAGEVGETLTKLLAESSLEDIQRTLYSFSIPLADIKSITNSAQTQSLILEMEGLRLRYSFKNFEELVNLLKELGRLGLTASK